jgi:hypothetical protein
MSALGAPAASLSPTTSARANVVPDAPKRLPLPWADRALCGAASPKLSEWAAYLQGFREHQVGAQRLYADRAVEGRVVSHTARLLGFARDEVQRATELTTEPPDIYVHRDLATLQKYSCVVGNVVAFYDGAMHLADVADDRKLRVELWYSVVHEYTHHALHSHGIREPIWFQEGLAMHVAREPWRGFDITPPGFDVRDMSDGFPHTATPKTAERFYGQAYQMLEFLRGLCQAKPDCGYPVLVRQLEQGAAPSTFFADTIALLAPSSEVTPLELWQMYFSGLRPAQ